MIKIDVTSTTFALAVFVIVAKRINDKYITNTAMYDRDRRHIQENGDDEEIGSGLPCRQPTDRSDSSAVQPVQHRLRPKTQPACRAFASVNVSKGSVQMSANVNVGHESPRKGFTAEESDLLPLLFVVCSHSRLIHFSPLIRFQAARSSSTFGSTSASPPSFRKRTSTTLTPSASAIWRPFL